MIMKTAIADFTKLGLTGREADVVFWITRGKSNAQIATILHISPGTVRKHLQHIFKKLGVKSRLAAATVAHDMLRVRPHSLR